ncbi:DNA-binding CsgD family transcriptional regulator/tetratricopeptide (TPR) repeat protein [Streptomyces sp. 3330]|uniref:AAA family ATPase n=1 Tax=Streptomyces sp. 3330 TaxID=2817755 RepID=UPI002859AAF3|nr:AAA family ATPase [Streptomyces sp. 3330]MDR6975133.1 DNA-binding CsgD family transcriptional regulator/tetratricopeptide (TPR) repeat protein [Streptomyces sp. 3330]
MTAPSEGPWLVHGGTAASLDRATGCPVGRERESDEVRDRLGDPAGPRTVLVRGERGAGRSAFLHALGERLRAEGTPVLALGCVPGDDARPLLLALRLIMALEEHLSGPPHRRAAKPAGEALQAAERRDGTAMAGLLCAVAARSTPVVVAVDDLHLADADSLAVLRGGDFARVPSPVRLLASAAGRGDRGALGRDGDRATSANRSTPDDPGRRPSRHGAAGVPDRRGDVPWAHTVVLSRLGPAETTAVVARRLRATPDSGLSRRVRELTHGVPGAIDALLTAWTRDGAIRVADGHAFIGTRTPTPVLPDGDRFVGALDTLSGPGRAVAGALSVLWPLGGRAAELIARSSGLSSGAVADGIRELADAEIVDVVPGPDGDGAGGWAFAVALTAHTLRERLGPLERSRLSATAVEALWADRDEAGGADGAAPAVPGLPDEADAVAYLADRVADAGHLVDRDRAVTELTAAAERLRPDAEGRGVLRWRRAVGNLVERPADRVPALQRYAKAAYQAGDYRTTRTIAESILRNLADVLGPVALQDTANLFTAATAHDADWRALSRLATAQWWDELRLPALVPVTGRALALCGLARWQEALDLLARTEQVWATDVRGRVKPGYFRAVAELVLGRPERFRRALDLSEAPHLGAEHVYALATTMFDELLSGRDLRAAEDLLAAQGLNPETLQPHSVFLWRHLQGRWDEALEPARWMLANDRIHTPAADSCLVPARTAAVLLARGRVTSARRLVDSARDRGEGGRPEYSLDAVEAEALRTLGDPDGAEKTLRRGLDAADAHGHVAGVDELWAALAEVYAETGHTAEAVTCLERLERIRDRTGGGRTRLTFLLASARVLRRESPGAARDALWEAVDLARSRSQPFETAVALVAAAEAGAGPPALLHEAYELFGTTGSALSRFRTRAAMREAGITVPGRARATAENERLLATLIAEGLTNRQIATVLRLSEDAVANRLSRLFARTGLRSRTEVVTAVLTGRPDRGLAPEPWSSSPGAHLV